MAAKIKKMLLIKGNSLYNAVRVFMDELKGEFEKKGIRCTFFDFSLYTDTSGMLSNEGYIELTKHLEEQPDAIFSACGMLLTSLEKIMKSQSVSIPMFAFFVDHPMWNFNRLSMFSEGYYAFFVDNTFARYASGYYNDFKVEGVVYQAGILSKKYMKPFEKRKRSIVFFGSYNSAQVIYQEIMDLSAMVGSSIAFVCEMMDYGIVHTEETIEEIATHIFLLHGILIPKEKFPKILSKMTIVESYLRAYFRIRSLQALVDSGIEVDVYGDGWENLPVKRREYLLVHSPVDYLEMADIMTEYRYSLNVLPWAKDGFHDRIATSMLNGCICITDTSTYIEAENLPGDKLIAYHLNEEDEMVHMVKESMASEKKAEEMARKGQEYALENHTWENRAAQFLKMMEYHL